MYAIIQTGGKQYKVQPGDTLRVERLEKNLGEEFDFTEVLAIGGDKTFIGEPTVSDAKVSVVVVNQARAPKVIVFKKKRRQGYRKMQGHRQYYTELFIKSISSPEGNESAKTKAVVFNPEKKFEEIEKTQSIKKETKETGSDSVVKKKIVKKKAVKKKAANKKVAVKKKTTLKKKVAKKTVTKKKALKKKTES